MVFDIRLELEKLLKDAQKARQVLTGIGDTAKREGEAMDATFRKLGSTIAGVFAADQLRQFAMQVVRVRGEFQQLEVAFRTMLQSKAKADDLMAQAVEFAAITPFGLQDVATGAKQLLAYGSAVEDVIGEIEMLGNVAAGLSVPLNDMIYLYGTLKSQGRAYTVDIRQFAGRGVPIYRELAKVLDVNVQEVNALIEAGKVGFPEVQQAFRNMTSEGGQFFNLMREQSKTVTGQISNLQDQISTTFNEIGQQNEGIINNAISGAAWLVEHYEGIGRALFSLISVYGAYKVALMATHAVQKAIMALNIGKRIASLIIQVRSLTQANRVLNVVLGANPYVKIASVLASVIGLTLLFASRTREAKEEMTGLEKATRSATDSFGKESAKLEVLLKRLDDTTLSYSEREKALKEIKSIVPDYHADLKEEGTLYNDNREAIDKYLSSLKKATFQNAVTEELTELIKRQREQEKAVEEARKMLEDAEERMEAQQAANPASFQGVGLRPVAVSVDPAKSIRLSFENATKALAETNRQIEELELEYKKLSVTAEDGTEKTVSVTEQLDDAYKGLEETMKRMSSIRAGSIKVANPSGELKQLKEQADEYRKTIELLTGKKTGTAENYNKSISEAMRKRMELEQDLEYQRAQARIDAMQDGAAKELEQLRLNHAQELMELERQKAELLEAMQEEERAVWERQNPDWKKEGKTFKPQTKTLPPSLESMFNDIGRLYNEQFAASVEATRNDLINEFGSYEEKRYQLAEQWEKKIAGLPAEYQPEARKQMENELFKLDSTYDQAYKKIFGNVSKMTKAQIQEAIKLGKEMMSKISSDTDPEAFKALADAVANLEEANDNYFSSGWEAGFDKILKAGMRVLSLQQRINKARKEGNKELAESYAPQLEREEGNLARSLAATGIQAFTSGLEKAAESMRQLAEASGDIELEGTAEIVSMISQNINAAAQGAAAAGHWIGAIVGGVQDIIGQIISMTINAKTYVIELNNSMEEFRKNIAMMQYELDDDKYDTIFGTNALRGAIDSYKIAQKAYKDYMDFVNKPMDKPEDKWWFWSTAEMQAHIRETVAYARGLNELQAMQIKTKDRAGKARDEYTSLFDLAPEIWGGDINGEFNVEAAKELLETNTKLTDEQRRQLETAIETKEAYDEALQSAKDYISDITGNLAESAAQAVENSILNGTDAWDEFEQAGLEAIAAIGRQMIMNKMLEMYFSKYEDDMLKALESDDPEEVAAGLAGILGQAIQGMPAILDAMGMTLEQFYAQMEQYGIDMDALSESQRQAAQKGIATASQDSVDELNGRFTAIQGHTYQINENVKIIAGYAGQQLSVLAQIEQNTRSLRKIEVNIGRMQADVGSMTLHGVAVQKL